MIGFHSSMFMLWDNVSRSGGLEVGNDGIDVTTCEFIPPLGKGASICTATSPLFLLHVSGVWMTRLRLSAGRPIHTLAI